MFGEPVADVAERIGMARQIDAVAQRRGRSGTRGDDGEVENREWNHGANLVRRAKQTKGAAAQIRHAPAARVPAVSGSGGWDKFSTAAVFVFCPPVHPKPGLGIIPITLIKSGASCKM